MDKEILKTIKAYKKRVEEAGIKIKKMVLFGSHTRDTATPDSDIDLVVVSDDFKEMDLWERLCLLGRARKEIKSPMEILGYTEKEYEEKGRGSFVGDEVKTGGVEV